MSIQYVNNLINVFLESVSGNIIYLCFKNRTPFCETFKIRQDE